MSISVKVYVLETSHGDDAMDHEKDSEIGLKDKLLLPVKFVKGADGKDYQVNTAELEFLLARRVTSALLRTLDPDSFAKYKAMKQADGGSLTARRNGYLYAFGRVLELCYSVPGL